MYTSVCMHKRIHECMFAVYNYSYTYICLPVTVRMYVHTVVLCTYLIAPAPQIIKQPVNTTAADPFGAHFSCTANGYGKIEITWNTENSKRGVPRKAIVTEERSPESVTSMIFIPDVALEDEGGYYCSARIGLLNALSQTAYLQEISK